MRSHDKPSGFSSCHNNNNHNQRFKTIIIMNNNQNSKVTPWTLEKKFILKITFFSAFRKNMKEDEETPVYINKTNNSNWNKEEKKKRKLCWRKKKFRNKETTLSELFVSEKVEKNSPENRDNFNRIIFDREMWIHWRRKTFPLGGKKSSISFHSKWKTLTFHSQNSVHPFYHENTTMILKDIQLER